MKHSRPLTCAEIRRVDAVASDEYGIPSVVLMENAGRGAAELIHQLAPEGRVALLCGRGNNGGDGFVIARHLEAIGRKLEVLLFASPASLSTDAMVNYQILRRSHIPVESLLNPDDSELAARLMPSAVVVDALLGTGAKGNPRSPLDGVIRVANHVNALRVAIDVPSGLDADFGTHGDCCFRADHTLTFVAEKVGFHTSDARRMLGQVHILPIGLTSQVLRSMNLETHPSQESFGA
jgi:NAD(P)H-hydrate epimerase